MATETYVKVTSEDQIKCVLSWAERTAPNLTEIWRERAWAAGAQDFLAGRPADPNYTNKDCPCYKAAAYWKGHCGYVSALTLKLAECA